MVRAPAAATPPPPPAQPHAIARLTRHPRARRRGFGSAGSFAALLTCANALFNANFDRIVRWVEDGGPMPFGGADDGEDEGDLMEQVAAAAADAPAAGGGAEAAADAGSEAAEAEAAQKRAAAAELRRRRLEQLAEQARAQAAQAEAAQAAQQADVDVGEPE